MPIGTSKMPNFMDVVKRDFENLATRIHRLRLKMEKKWPEAPQAAKEAETESKREEETFGGVGFVLPLTEDLVTSIRDAALRARATKHPTHIKDVAHHAALELAFEASPWHASLVNMPERKLFPPTAAILQGTDGVGCARRVDGDTDTELTEHIADAHSSVLMALQGTDNHDTADLARGIFAEKQCMARLHRTNTSWAGVSAEVEELEGIREDLDTLTEQRKAVLTDKAAEAEAALRIARKQTALVELIDDGRTEHEREARKLEEWYAVVEKDQEETPVTVEERSRKALVELDLCNRVRPTEVQACRKRDQQQHKGLKAEKLALVQTHRDEVAKLEAEATTHEANLEAIAQALRATRLELNARNTQVEELTRSMEVDNITAARAESEREALEERVANRLQDVEAEIRALNHLSSLQEAFERRSEELHHTRQEYLEEGRDRLAAARFDTLERAFKYQLGRVSKEQGLCEKLQGEREKLQERLEEAEETEDADGITEATAEMAKRDAGVVRHHDLRDSAQAALEEVDTRLRAVMEDMMHATGELEEWRGLGGGDVNFHEVGSEGRGVIAVVQCRDREFRHPRVKLESVMLKQGLNREARRTARSREETAQHERRLREAEEKLSKRTLALEASFPMKMWSKAVGFITGK